MLEKKLEKPETQICTVLCRPHLPRSVTHGPGTMTTTHMLQSARQAFAERLEEPQDAFFYDMMRGARLTEQ